MGDALTHAVHPEIALSLCESWRSCHADTPCHRCTAHARCTCSCSMHCSYSMHQAASRRPFGVGDEIAIARDRIHIITGGEGDLVPHFTHRTPCDRVTRPTPRRSIRAAYRMSRFGISRYAAIEWPLHGDSFLVEDRRDGGGLLSSVAMRLRAYIFCEFSVARIECSARLIIHRSTHI